MINNTGYYPHSSQFEELEEQYDTKELIVSFNPNKGRKVRKMKFKK